MQRIVVIILNYRTANLCVDCLKGLAAERFVESGMCCVVADAASGDDSARVIGDAIADFGWSEWVRLVPLDVNGGFAFGNNAVIRELLSAETPPDYVWLLNPDTIIRITGSGNICLYTLGSFDHGSKYFRRKFQFGRVTITCGY